MVYPIGRGWPAQFERDHGSVETNGGQGSLPMPDRPPPDPADHAEDFARARLLSQIGRQPTDHRNGRIIELGQMPGRIARTA